VVRKNRQFEPGTRQIFLGGQMSWFLFGLSCSVSTLRKITKLDWYRGRYAVRNLVLWPSTSLFIESSYCPENGQIYLPNGFHGRIKQHKEWRSRRDERNDLRSRINVFDIHNFCFEDGFIHTKNHVMRPRSSEARGFNVCLR
jgi:hypothetical protein